MTPFGITMFVLGGIGLLVLIVLWLIDRKSKKKKPGAHLHI